MKPLELELSDTSAQHAFPQSAMNDWSSFQWREELRSRAVAAVESRDVAKLEAILAEAKHPRDVRRYVVCGSTVSPTPLWARPRYYFRPEDDRHLLVVAASLPGDVAATIKILAFLIPIDRFGMRLSSYTRRLGRFEPDPPVRAKTYAVNAALKHGNLESALFLLACGAFYEPMNPPSPGDESHVNAVDAEIWKKLKALNLHTKLTGKRTDRADLLGNPAKFLVFLEREMGTPFAELALRLFRRKKHAWMSTGPSLEKKDEYYKKLAKHRPAGWHPPATCGVIERAIVHKWWSPRRCAHFAWPYQARRWATTTLLVAQRLANQKGRQLLTLPPEIWHIIIGLSSPAA